MFYRLSERLGRSYFSWRTREIYATSPLQLSSGPLVLSQLRHKDVGLYLIAIKSFARQVPPGEVVILNDGSLTEQDVHILKTHVPHLELLSAYDFQHPRLPRGGCWERLIALAHLNRQRYCIQLDADTLTRGPLPEVSQRLSEQIAFTLGTWDDQEIEPMRACSLRVQAKSPNPTHVQLAAEAAFTYLPEVDRLKYVRGCAAFVGFPPQTLDIGFIVDFSQAMHQLLGEKWYEWGSEQVMSNVLVANAPKAKVLPHPDYSDCLKMIEATRFIHFIGPCRFRGVRYAKAARQVIAALQGAQDAA